ncbi:hypothetical protein [Shouchella lonarensis]|nr:hypothetical protein [Shouchella lonarensis]
MNESRLVSMIVVSEGWFQTGLILLMCLLLAGSLIIVRRKLRRSKKQVAGKKEAAATFLTCVMVVTLYFAISLSFPRAFYADLLLSESKTQLITRESMRYMSFSPVFKLYVIERGPIIRPAQEMSVSIETNDYTPLYTYAKKYEHIVRSDQSIDMQAYVDAVIVPELAKLDDESLTLTELKTALPHHTFTFIENMDVEGGDGDE